MKFEFSAAVTVVVTMKGGRSFCIRLFGFDAKYFLDVLLDYQWAGMFIDARRVQCWENPYTDEESVLHWVPNSQSAGK